MHPLIAFLILPWALLYLVGLAGNKMLEQQERVDKERAEKERKETRYRS
jgi:hypothetical protein